MPCYAETHEECLICSECEEHITSCRFENHGYEYGNFDIPSEDYDCDGFEGGGETVYYCPECGDAIDPYDLRKAEETKPVKEEEETEEVIKIRVPKPEKSMFVPHVNHHYSECMSRAVECKKCNTLNINNDDEWEINCTKCNSIIDCSYERV